VKYHPCSFYFFLSFFVTRNFTRVLRRNRKPIFVWFASYDANSGLLHQYIPTGITMQKVSIFPHITPKNTGKKAFISCE